MTISHSPADDGRKNSSESSCYAYIYCYFYVFTQLYKSLKYHSWELFERNGGDGFGELSESGLEADNKFMTAIHTSKSRKISEEACPYDTVSRMWDQSNPYINSFQPVTHPLSSAFKGTKEGADPLEDRINDLDFS